MSASAARIAYLDGWRAVAIALVLLDHISMNKATSAFYDAHGLRFLSEFGEVGVFVFFFISGHVVARASLAEVARTGGFDAFAFYMRRWFRIMPPFMLYLCVCLLLGRLGAIDFTPGNFLSAALYLCNTSAPHVSCDWTVGHSWSLAFEEQFYLLFPLIFARVELNRAPHRSAVALVGATIALPIVFPIWWIGVSGVLIAHALFFAGYLSAKYAKNVAALFATRRAQALLVSALIVFMPRSLIAALGDDEPARAALIDALRLAQIVATPALVILSGLTPLTRDLLSHPRLSALGRATYSIYLWQQLFAGPPFNALAPALQLILLAAMAACCVLFYVYVETRIIEWGRAVGHAASGARPGARFPATPSLVSRPDEKTRLEDIRSAVVPDQ
ncbi:MAG: acyltransferase [Methylocystis sp.]|nr:acyltransferase [Methylocystis sp.]